MSFNLSLAEISAIRDFHRNVHVYAPTWAKCPFTRCNLIKKRIREEWPA